MEDTGGISNRGNVPHLTVPTQPMVLFEWVQLSGVLFPRRINNTNLPCVNADINARGKAEDEQKERWGRPSAAPTVPFLLGSSSARGPLDIYVCIYAW